MAAPKKKTEEPQEVSEEKKAAAPKEDTSKPPVIESVEEPSSESGSDSTGSDEHFKWQAALAYLPLVCLIPLFLNRENEYIQRHARQGFILFVIEILALLLTVDAIWYLVFYVCLAAGIVGAIGILIKGEIKIPFLSDLGDRIHI